MSSLKYESQVRPPLVVGDKSYHQISEDIIRPIENRPSKLWWTGFIISVLLLCFGIFSVTREVIYGVGQWNLNKTIGWAWDITNFVWWIGIGHAGTLICHPFIIQTAMENRCESCCRSDDHFCGDVRGTVSDMAYGTCLDSILLFALSKYAWCIVAEF